MRNGGIALHGYMLMDDRVHLLATPSTAEGLGKAVRRSAGATSRFDARRARSGSRGRSLSRGADRPGAVLPGLSRHLEMEPVRHGLVVVPEDYRWSSAAMTRAGAAIRW